MKRTQREYLAVLEWNMRDAEQALSCAVSMRDWTGVTKYAGQIRKLQERHFRANQQPRLCRLWGCTAGQVFGRGRIV
jgi:hypothetical protein